MCVVAHAAASMLLHQVRAQTLVNTRLCCCCRCCMMGAAQLLILTTGWRCLRALSCRDDAGGAGGEPGVTRLCVCC